MYPKSEYCTKPVDKSKGWHESCRLSHCEDLLAQIQEVKYNIKGLPRKVWEAMHRDNFVRDPNSSDFKIRIMTQAEIQESRRKSDINKTLENVFTQVFGVPKK